MEAIIQITTDEQGWSVVSARELHRFLECGKDFSDWIKHRIKKYGLVENQDYEVFLQTGENPSGGRPATEYALTLDAAKELAMVEGNEKGKQARQYFIEAEKALRRQLTEPTQLTTEQLLLQLAQQQTQLLTSQQEQINQLRADMQSFMAGVRPAKPVRAGQQLSLPGVPVRLTSTRSELRQSIGRKVSDYCGYYGAEPGETYNYLYKRLYDVYGINVYRFQRNAKESILDALERYGHLDRLYALITAELIYREE